MKLNRYYLTNFRRLEDVKIDISEKDTIFVGPNNSGKTSAAAAFRLFISRSRQFRIHDFSASLLRKIDALSTKEDGSEADCPSIDFDLWFAIDPDSEYGRVSKLLPKLSANYSEVGIRISYSLTKISDLLKSYKDSCKKPDVAGEKRKTLTEFLAGDKILSQFFKLKYFKLEILQEKFDKDKLKLVEMDEQEGQEVLAMLLQVDFVDAQRNINDNDAAGTNRLSSALAEFYKFNLEKLENDQDAIAVVDKSNESLSAHYAKQFSGLIKLINQMGIPSVNDRDLRILSTLNPETLLRGNTTLLYVEQDSDHHLPEAYNGLGFKNLIYIVVQVTHFQRRWLSTEKGRPLCHLIFIEEPEVHLHAQVQQAFIRQIGSITEKTLLEYPNSGALAPQLLISTHSSHIIAEADFTSIRYFQRVESKHADPAVAGKKVATNVLRLSEFDGDNAEGENLKFLKKYLKLTHCDLFFCDATILVEGTVERLLLPRFIEERATELKAAYLSILEIGGAYAHLLIPLVNFIGLPCLVITDLDSVDPSADRKACRADLSGAVTSNKAISSLIGKTSIKDLIEVRPEQRSSSEKGHRYISYQGPVRVPDYGADAFMTPRTFEEAFIYENMKAVRENKLEVFVKLPVQPDYKLDYDKVFESVKAKQYKKVEFALNQLSTEEPWITPTYIAEGLDWLKGKLATRQQGGVA